MKTKRRSEAVAAFMLMGGVLLAGSLRATPAHASEAVSETEPAKDSSAAPTAESHGKPGIHEKEHKAFPVPPPPFTDGIFPCSDCHADMEPNLERRELEDEHDQIKLHHGPRDRWCFDCHNPTDRDKLRLASGKLIDFSESYKLCGQCHGPKLRDWRVGVHGKRTGNWNGEKRYLLCAHCHNPHAPRFKPLAPKPPPVRPRDLR